MRKEPSILSSKGGLGELAMQTHKINRPKEVGVYYKATVPDTLELIEHARYGVNHFTSIISEENNYEMYWGVMRCIYPKDIMKYLGREDWPQLGYEFGEVNPPVINFQFSPLMACQPKCMEALTMERLISGSEQHLEREAKMLEMMTSLIGDDGLYYVPDDPKKWWLGPAKDRPYANTHGQGRMIGAIIAWYQYTGNSMWKELIDRMVNGIDRHLVVHKDNYAYVPAYGWPEAMYFRSCYIKGRGWKDTSEPTSEKFGEEGSLFNHQGHIPGVLTSWYRLTGNKQALRLAGEMVRFLLKPKFWADFEKGDYPGVVGAEHAHWQGHFHGYINTLRSILEYAIATNDARMKSFVRDGYEWARQAGWARIGLVGDAQGCACGRLIGLAIKLTDAGIGDYWEDVDQYVRNQGVEMQFVPEDIPYLKNLSKGKPAAPEDPCYHSGEDVYDMMIGAYSHHAPVKSGSALCCSPWGNMGLFYAWDGTLRYADGMVQINLLLNRASPWMDIDSYLPYEGKVLLKSKQAQGAIVRIPLWVDKEMVKCQIDKRRLQPQWLGNYIRFDRLEKDDEVTIEFPMEEKIEKWTAPPQNSSLNASVLNWQGRIKAGETWSARFRGNTLVDITPPLSPRSPLYQRRAEKYSTAKTPMREVIRYVSRTILKW